MARDASAVRGRDAWRGLVVATSHAALRRRITEGLRRTFGASSVHDAKDWSELEGRLVARRPSIVLLALPLRGFVPLEGLGTIRTLSPVSQTIVMADPPAEGAAVEALKQGARGYCARTTDHAVICKAIELVRQGEIWVGRKVMLRLLDELTERHAVRTDQRDADLRLLTRREQQIRGLIAGGASNKEVADRLVIAEKTVKAHLTHIFRKLGLSSRLQLAVYGLHPSFPPTTKVPQTQVQ
jgi:two-component system, NarL family, nitrate/nitrite response regulator NarL